MSKRTEMMIVQDRAKVCELLNRGYRDRTEIAEVINLNRDKEFHISVSQVQADIAYMKNKLIEEGLEDLSLYRKEAVENLTYLMKTYYEAYERSCKKKITLEVEGSTTDAEYEEALEYAEQNFEEYDDAGPGKKLKKKEEFRTEGNPAFLNGVKNCLDSIHKIQGVDGATKVALTDPTGIETLGILEMMKGKIDDLSGRTEIGMLEPGNVVDAEEIHE